MANVARIQRPGQRPAGASKPDILSLLLAAGIPTKAVEETRARLKTGQLAVIPGMLYQRFNIPSSASVAADTVLQKLYKSGIGDARTELGFASGLTTIADTNLQKDGALADGEFFIPRFLAFEFPHNINKADAQALRHVLVRLKARGGNQTLEIGKLDMFPALHRYEYEQFVNPSAVTTSVTLPDGSPAGVKHRTIGATQSIYGRLVIRGSQLANQTDYIELRNSRTWSVTTADTEIESRLYGDWIQSTSNR